MQNLSDNTIAMTALGDQFDKLEAAVKESRPADSLSEERIELLATRIAQKLASSLGGTVNEPPSFEDTEVPQQGARELGHYRRYDHSGKLKSLLPVTVERFIYSGVRCYGTGTKHRTRAGATGE